jgi:uncharacterized membrane protein YsdA (DUF1294 family)
VPPPAPQGTISLMGLAGYSSANVMVPLRKTRHKTNKPINFTYFFILSLLSVKVAVMKILLDR